MKSLIAALATLQEPWRILSFGIGIVALIIIFEVIPLLGAALVAYLCYDAYIFMTTKKSDNDQTKTPN